MPTPSPAAPRKIPGKAPGRTLFHPIDADHSDHPAVEVLLVSGTSGTRALFVQSFQRSNWRLEFVTTPTDAILRLKENPMAIVIYEECPSRTVGGAAESWLELIEQTRNLAHPPKVIVASSEADDRMWAEVLHQGGYDVLPLPLEPADVMRTVSMAWLEWRHELEASGATRHMAVGASY